MSHSVFETGPNAGQSIRVPLFVLQCKGKALMKYRSLCVNSNQLKVGINNGTP